MTESTELLMSDIERVADAIRTSDRFLLTTHENPDGDALGSLLGMHRILEALGNKVINIDHHHDNTRFGTINLVDVDASCTAEIVYDLSGLLDVQLTPEIANALYVGLVTDTGKFMYENTDARSHRMAAGMLEAGVGVNEIYRRLYEHAPIEKLKLLARALEGVTLRDGGRLAVTYISTEDYAVSGASEALTEGIIDHLRTIDGAVVAAVVRDQADGGRAARKVSMRP